MAMQLQSRVYIDGPNGDMVLGNDLLGGRCPRRHERPRLERIRAYCDREFGPSQMILVLNGNKFCSRVFPFYRKALSLGYDVQCPRGEEGDPVDTYIQDQLRMIARFERPGSVAVMSHDGGSPFTGFGPFRGNKWYW